MSNRINWSHEADSAILHLRSSGVSWHGVATRLSVGRNSVIERARRLGLPALKTLRRRPPRLLTMRIDRPSLPAGHPITWAALTDGTLLESSPYPFPVFL